MITYDTKIRVLYRDTDKMGVVYHANYIVFYEAGQLLNTGKTVLGYVNTERMRPCRAPQQVIDELQKYFE